MTGRPAVADDRPVAGRPVSEARQTTVVVAGLPSDAHTWNLVFLQLLLEELGCAVVNLGPCVPEPMLVDACRRCDPGLIVLSSVNGLGYQDGLRVIRRMRACPDLTDTPVAIGGKLGVRGAVSAAGAADLIKAGFSAVFDDGQHRIATFREFVSGLGEGRRDGDLTRRQRAELQ